MVVLNNNFQTSEFTSAGQQNKKLNIPDEKLDCPNNLNGLDNSDVLRDL